MSNQPPDQPDQTGQPPPYSQSPGQVPGQQQPFVQAPPKQKHTLRNVLLVILALFVLMVGGCIALVVTAANQVDKAVKKSQSQDARAGGANNPMPIVPGQPFDVSGFKYQSGWRVGKDVFGDVTIKNLRVTNQRGHKDSALVEIKFWRGTEVLALSDCTTSPIAPNTTVTLSCSSSDKLPKQYGKITINDAF